MLLAECDVRLQEVCAEVIMVMDFAVITGHRGMEAQNEALASGRSKLAFPRSKHNTFPSLAIDIAPYPIDWHDHKRFILLAGIMLGIAHKHNIKLRWGGDWKSNFNLKENKFPDLPHFEIVE